MHDFILDANILISMMISGKSAYKPFLAYFNFYTPEYSLGEISKYQDVIFEKSRLKPDELRQYIMMVFEQISVVPKLVLTSQSIQKAIELSEGIDQKDAGYLALSFQVDTVLLTRDKPLYHGVRAKGFRKILLFDDFLKKAYSF
ncbi:MAG: DNA-binding protein [Lewinellaceae bacterium]|nr:DNA-binding protein [Lewinellaceae bacterium]